MKIDKRYLRKYYHYAVIDQLKEEYRKKGYAVSVDEKLPNSNYRADLILSYDDEECEAVFGMGGASRSLHIYFPKPSNDIEYSFMWFH